MQTIGKYFIILPTEEAHHQTHLTSASVALVQKLHPHGISKIHELVLAGVTESIEMKRHLKYCVTNCLCKDKPPDPNDRAYFLYSW